jgi:hypothetical protein
MIVKKKKKNPYILAIWHYPWLVSRGQEHKGQIHGWSVHEASQHLHPIQPTTYIQPKLQIQSSYLKPFMYKQKYRINYKLLHTTNSTINFYSQRILSSHVAANYCPFPFMFFSLRLITLVLLQ